MISLKSIIAPSVLSSDFAHLAAESQKMKDYGCEWLHLDIIDGHFAPNITFGPPVIKSLRPYSDLFFDCHCMVSDPKRWILDLKKAGVDQVNFHIEATGIVEHRDGANDETRKHLVVTEEEKNRLEEEEKKKLLEEKEKKKRLEEKEKKHSEEEEKNKKHPKEEKKNKKHPGEEEKNKK
eukprot:1064350_1